MRAWIAAAALLSTVQIAAAQVQDGDPSRGQGAYRACAACHALEPNRNMTGPSLAGLWGRKAGGLESFRRYSKALKSANVVWDDQTLDPWLKDPQGFIPGNHMTFPGIKDAQVRADLLAFLRDVTRPGAAPPQSAGREPGTSGMMSMGGGAVPNLKKLDPGDRVQRVGYCGDTYRVTTADGESRDFWERNLRFKTDSGVDGPEAGAPALVRAGMMGDRANVIFARPEEFAHFVQRRCGEEAR